MIADGACLIDAAKRQMRCRLEIQVSHYRDNTFGSKCGHAEGRYSADGATGQGVPVPGWLGHNSMLIARITSIKIGTRALQLAARAQQGTEQVIAIA